MENGGGTPLLARWTEDFDCGRETNWWYVIKDTPFDLSLLKAKRRYEINKGIKLFDVRRIEDAENYAESLFEIACDAYEDYPKAYRPAIEKNAFISSIETWSEYDVYGAFSKNDGVLKAFALLKPYEQYSDFMMMKSMRSEEKAGVNAALINSILSVYNSKFINGYYICDGSRNISHETAFQEYLEKYFGFRKAYCRLCIQYAPKVRFFINLIYPFRNVIWKIKRFTFFHNVSAILKMEEFAREE